MQPCEICCHPCPAFLGMLAVVSWVHVLGYAWLILRGPDVHGVCGTEPLAV